MLLNSLENKKIEQLEEQLAYISLQIEEQKGIIRQAEKAYKELIKLRTERNELISQLEKVQKESVKNQKSSLRIIKI